MSINRRLLHIVTGLSVIALWLGACQPAQDTPQPEMDSNAVPAHLRVIAKIDSIITPIEPIDISSVSDTGEGPTGALIRKEEFGDHQTFTYDKQGRPISALYVHDNAWSSAEIVRYEGDYLAEKYSVQHVNLSRSAPHILYLKKYRYNVNKQLKQVLFYSRNSDTAPLTLIISSMYEYDSSGKLRLMRDTSINRGYHSLKYWENGDCVRQEHYYTAPTGNNPNSTVVQISYAYDQQVNPLSDLPFDGNFGGFSSPPSKHYQTHFIIHTSESTGPFAKVTENEVENGYQHDAQGRVISTRTRELPNGIWSGWGLNAFTYAP